MASSVSWPKIHLNKSSLNMNICVDKYLGISKSYFAALGAASAALVGVTAAYQVAKGITTYCLASPLALGINVREFGEWAGIGAHLGPSSVLASSAAFTNTSNSQS
jgi:hypothetical protein